MTKLQMLGLQTLATHEKYYFLDRRITSSCKVDAIDTADEAFYTIVQNYFKFFSEVKRAFLPPWTNSPFFELKKLVNSQFTTFINNVEYCNRIQL